MAAAPSIPVVSEHIIDAAQPAPLSTTQRETARRVLYELVETFEAADNVRSTSLTFIYPRLVRYTYEYSLSDESRDIFLRAFMDAMGLGFDEAAVDTESLKPLFTSFAAYLLDNFYLPLKASTRRTPQPSPAYHSAVLRAQANDALAFTSTPERLSSLRGACLVRDRHRCVVTRAYDTDEFHKRYMQDTVNARDDDGVLFGDNALLRLLEVAHILPHSLSKRGTTAELDASRQAALAILNMFDLGVAHTIDGVDVDRPRNALTLTHEVHRSFGGFDVFFEPVPGASNTYWIRSFLPPPINHGLGLPVQRTLFVTDTRTIDPPSPRLLAVHRAIAHILHLSAAGGYIDSILRDLEDGFVRADGSSELGRMVSLALGAPKDGGVIAWVTELTEPDRSKNERATKFTIKVQTLQAAGAAKIGGDKDEL